MGALTHVGTNVGTHVSGRWAVFANVGTNVSGMWADFTHVGANVSEKTLTLVPTLALT
jgi:hypothetical protein